MRMHDSSERTDHSSPSTRGKRRFDDDADTYSKRGHRQQLEAVDETPDDGHRWSTWDQSTPTEKGPLPHPDWLVTELAAVDTELGMLKTGKEADVFLVERGVPDTDRRCLLAAKRYRASEHRMFHRDAGYLEGRRVKRVPGQPGDGGRTDFGRQVIAGQWAEAEFGALCRLLQLGVPVPYPVQILGTELLLEFIGDGRRHAGRATPGPAPPGHGRPGRSVGSSWSTRCAPWRGPASPTATCRRTTCSSTMAGWSSSTCRRSWTWWRTRRAGSSSDRDARNVATWFPRTACGTRTGTSWPRDLARPPPACVKASRCRLTIAGHPGQLSGVPRRCR